MRYRKGGHTWIPIREAAEQLAVTTRQVYRLLAAGSLTGQRDLNTTFVQLASIQTYAAKRGPWNPAGVTGGRAAAEAMQVPLPWLEEQP